METSKKRDWWREAIVYQVYPRSFQDSNADGIGDLPGILSRLDYVADLGVTCIWLSPIFPSPMADFGYDVSDHVAIHPDFGTMDDFLALLTAVHDRDMRLILDYVPNHTSDQHLWFCESRSDRSNSKRDWYIWRDPAPDGGPPNNWVSHFGGSAWQWESATKQFYLHSFLKEQPDLDWRNPAVVEAMLKVLRFWLDQGVDGFRLDALDMTIKDDGFRDDPVSPDYRPDQPIWLSRIHEYSHNRPELHELLRRMRAVVDEYSDRMMIGEIYLPVEECVKYYGEQLDECHMPFNFQLIESAFEPAAIQRVIEHYENTLTPELCRNWVLGNHDRDRIASVDRAGPANARIAQMLLFALPGVLTCYYGDELGLPNGVIAPEQIQDPMALNEPGVAKTRDVARTPMLWDAGPWAGFSTQESWLPVHFEYERMNVTVQQQEPRSMLKLFKALVRLRKAQPTLIFGSCSALTDGNDMLALVRRDKSVCLLAVFNFSDREQTYDFKAIGRSGELLLVTNEPVLGESIGKGRLSLTALNVCAHSGVIMRVIE